MQTNPWSNAAGGGAHLCNQVVEQQLHVGRVPVGLQSKLALCGGAFIPRLNSSDKSQNVRLRRPGKAGIQRTKQLQYLRTRGIGGHAQARAHAHAESYRRS